MDYVCLGATGLEVSRICLGCMSYGEPDRGAHPWSLDEEAAEPFFRQALDAGINFFDTANVYSAGSSEEITGRALLRGLAAATRSSSPPRSTAGCGRDPTAQGLSRKAILAEIDASLRRLGTDYVDLYQIHRWDYDTPIEETLEALHDVVKAGKARYIGASSMYAWQFAKALYLADLHGWTRFVSMQNHYNLLYREEEREMLPLCVDQGIGVIPWSPLARGRLTRAWDATDRTLGDRRVRPLALRRRGPVRSSTRSARWPPSAGIPRAQVALAWLLGKSGRRRAHRGGDQAPPPRRRRRGRRSAPRRLGGRVPGEGLPAARRGRLQLTSPPELVP